jgi:hypothetical protein
LKSEEHISEEGGGEKGKRRVWWLVGGIPNVRASIKAVADVAVVA